MGLQNLSCYSNHGQQVGHRGLGWFEAESSDVVQHLLYNLC
jgi:hypothetical protein